MDRFGIGAIPCWSMDIQAGAAAQGQRWPVGQGPVRRFDGYRCDFEAAGLALLWQNLAIDRRYWIPESGFQ
jgi:hypothetical protein